MRQAGDLTSHIPSAPSVFDRTFLVRNVRLTGGSLRAGRGGIDGPQQHTRNVACSGCDVALRAVQFGPLKHGLVYLVFIQQIEDGALHWIEGDNFNCLAIVYLAHVDVVVEIEGPRMLRRDFFVLKACL